MAELQANGRDLSCHPPLWKGPAPTTPPGILGYWTLGGGGVEAAAAAPDVVGEVLGPEPARLQQEPIGTVRDQPEGRVGAGALELGLAL